MTGLQLQVRMVKLQLPQKELAKLVGWHPVSICRSVRRGTDDLPARSAALLGAKLDELEAAAAPAKKSRKSHPA